MNYKLINHRAAPDFLTALAPTASHFRPDGEYIYRGQCRDLPLLPSAFREEKMSPMMTKRPSRPWPQWSNVMQMRAELRLIGRFYELADRAGLTIPEDSHQVRLILRTVDRDPAMFVASWPPGELWSLIALAQHHGVPTRFLDWTHSPWVAAYFAAAGVLSCDADKLHECSIVVWAFDLSMAELSVPDESDEGDDEGVNIRAGEASGFVEAVTTPYANNRNLAAQKGIHLLYRPTATLTPRSRVQRESFDAALQRAHETVEHMKILFKFVLPTSEAASLLKLLSKYGVSGATLFPGLDGVVRAMHEERKWR